MINSLPICTIVFDNNAELVDMNKLASDFFGIENREDYLNRKLRLATNYVYIQNLIEELKTGKTISNECLKFMRVDKSEVYVGFSATMLYGLKSVFIFQFFEIPPYSNSDFQFLINSASYDIRTLQSDLKEFNINLSNVVNSFYACPFTSSSSRKDSAIQLFATKYSTLTPSECIICGLIVKGATLKEIAEVQNKSTNFIYGTIKQILLKLEMRSRKELYYQLKKLDVFES